VPLFALKWPDELAPPVRKEGFWPTAGRAEPEAAPPPEGPLIAIAVGKTNEGESFPANPTEAISTPIAMKRDGILT
jgi:hypothetical protein